MIKTIQLSQLELDSHNPRLKKKGLTQRELLQYFTQQSKTMNLAKHISESGLNPTELLMVIEHPDNPSSYVVLEGNRRLAALKALENIEVVADSQKIQYKKFQNGRKLETNISCYIAPSREAAREWILLKHSGEQDGVGVVDWDAEEKERYSPGDNSESLKLLDYAREAKILDDSMQKFPLTTLTRLMNSYFEEKVGLSVSDNKLSGNFDDEKNRKILSKVIGDLHEGNEDSRTLVKVTDIKNYLDRVLSEEVSADKSTSDPTNPRDKTKAKPDNTKDKPIGGGIRAPSKPTAPQPDRKKLIPSSFPVKKISHTRVSRIYAELKKLDLEQYPNAGAVMTRVFIELSLDAYEAINKIDKYELSQLPAKMAKVAEYLENEKKVKKSVVAAMKRMTSDPKSICSITALNACVHSGDWHPKASDLVNTWDNISEAMILILSEI